MTEVEECGGVLLLAAVVEVQVDKVYAVYVPFDIKNYDDDGCENLKFLVFPFLWLFTCFSSSSSTSLRMRR
jgi:hypothetical protein